VSIETGTVFTQVNYNVGGLLHYIDTGDIGLPDIQRPFVWSATKVRDLFDSMYRGFPVGYLLFWANAEVNGARAIGTDDKAHKVPRLLIIDGQQRLTSLYAVFRGRAVLTEDYLETRIEIAFRPRDATFAVADAAIRKDPEYIANISELWTSGKKAFALITDFLKKLEAKHPLTDDERDTLSENLNKLISLDSYPFTALEIASTVDEEQVADIFVRINSEGTPLNQADFILTLLSVFWEEGRRDMEAFSRASRLAPGPNAKPSPFNYFIQPGPDQLLRVSVALGFDRGRLRSVYQVLRGRDLETGTFSPELRAVQFARLQEAQAHVLDLTHWHQFLHSLVGAGFRGREMVSSQNTLLYAYAFYLIGKTRCGVPTYDLQRLIGRWFFAATITGRYTASPETAVEADLNRTKGIRDAATFVATLNALMASALTNDFWTITLPGELETSAATGPYLAAYHAAQNQLGAPVLFSTQKVSDLLDPALRLKKKALERHHLFPRAWLERQGIKDLRVINQVANMALLEWPDNIDISDTPPVEYLPKMRERFGDAAWAQMCELHALPDGWETLPYEEFLRQRRVLMAAIIRRGYEALAPELVAAAVAPSSMARPEP
jgi:hypothetical protein